MVEKTFAFQAPAKGFIPQTFQPMPAWYCNKRKHQRKAVDNGTNKYGLPKKEGRMADDGTII